MVRGNQPDPRYTRGRSTSGQRGSCHSTNGRSGDWSAPTQYNRQNGFAEDDPAECDNNDWKGIAEHERQMLEEMYAMRESTKSSATIEMQATKSEEVMPESESARGYKRTDFGNYTTLPLSAFKRTDNHADCHDTDTHFNP